MNRKCILTICSIAWISLLLPCVIGCGLIQELPTGEAVLSAEAIETVDTMATVAEAAAGVSLLLPGTAGIGGIILGLAGAWRKMKPKVESAKSEAELGQAAGEATSLAIDAYKKANPDDWEKLEAFLTKYHGQAVENFYRSLRGLSRKQ